MTRRLFVTNSIGLLFESAFLFTDYHYFKVPSFLSFSFKFIFLLKDNCFTEFCCFLSNLNMNQPQVYMYPLPFEPPSHLLPHPIPLGWYRAPVWVSWAIQQIPIGYLFYIWSFKREGIYVYPWLTHVEVWQKTTKFCEAIILQ